MVTYISLLRGINVSGQKLIRMEALRSLYERMGFKNVSTYVQSGNVVFTAKETPVEKLELKISGSILKEFGFEVPVLVLTMAELSDIIDGNPFQDRDSTYLYITFLKNHPAQEFVNPVKLSGKLLPGEEFSLREKVVYFHCPKGYGQTKLNNNFLENQLKVTASTRNWKTTSELLRMAKLLNTTETASKKKKSTPS